MVENFQSKTNFQSEIRNMVEEEFPEEALEYRSLEKPTFREKNEAVVHSNNALKKLLRNAFADFS